LALNNIEEQAVLPATVRMTRRLVQMAHSYGQTANNGSTYRTLTITQEELALMVGVSRQTTNLILNNLKDLQLIRVQRGVLEILDLPALRRLQVPSTLTPASKLAV
jgi:CRP-like cAMP-binding protein